MSSEQHRFGLSTSWNGQRQTRLADLLDEHQRLGFRRLEAYALHTPPNLTELGALARERDIEITSLHAPAPSPWTSAGNRARWVTGSPRPTRPTAALPSDTVKRTIDAASELGARGIVIHLGHHLDLVTQRTIVDTIARDGRDSPAHRAGCGAGAPRPEANKGPQLAAAIESIRELGEHAVGSR